MPDSDPAIMLCLLRSKLLKFIDQDDDMESSVMAEVVRSGHSLLYP